jgi:mannitol-1-phosphate 5-dehydrogenase
LINNSPIALTKTAIIFGAGKTGRGFAAHLAFLGGADIILVDKSRQLVDDLKKAGEYFIQVLDKEEKRCTIRVEAVYHIDDPSWHDAFVQTGLTFTAVFGNNLEELARYLAPALQKKHLEKPEQPLTIITCENRTSAAAFLKEKVLQNLGQENERWLLKQVGFSEAIIFSTCLEASSEQSSLTIRAQNFFELPCNGEEIKGDLPVYGLKPLKNFGNQLRRKIYTYNCINAVITYLGARKGYTQLYEAGADEAILVIARKAAAESSRALVAEFGFDPAEQEAWTKAAFAKFSDRNIPDPIERNGADPVRKLSREDRLIGPALLALKHRINPEGLLEGIMACFEYNDSTNNRTIAHTIQKKGPDAVLKEICGLSEEEELFKLIKAQILKRRLHER